MKRFLYDAAIIMILVLIGLSLDDSSTIVDQQEELNSFQQEIKEGGPISNKREKSVMNQIKDNSASSLAKDASYFIGSIVEGSVRFVSNVFESIVKEP